MSILIKGMEMPESCGWCRFEGGGYCFAKGEEILHVGKREDVHRDCPLIELPPHGRLIDVDALESRLSDLLMFPSNLVNGQWILNMIRETPTVIPAEEVYADGYDTAGNYHWTGTHTGEHIIPAEEET